MNDLPLASNFETTLFADNTNLHISHPNLKALQNLVSLEITKIENWVCQNKLTINCKKSACMLISDDKSNTSVDFKLSLNHYVINRTNNLKYLGGALDNKLSWKTHIDNIVTRLSRICVLYKLRHLVPTSILKSVYYSRLCLTVM